MGQPTLIGDPGYWLSGVQIYWAMARQRLRRGPVFPWRFVGPVPERLAMVPPDLRPYDPLVARDIYEGRFTFAGRSVETGGVSPFSVEAPSREWEERLNGFRWLRHLKGADSELASSNARALVRDWIQTQGRSVSGPAWRLGVTGARVIAWIQYSRLLLQDSDHLFYRRFMVSLARQIRYLRSLARAMEDDIDALTVRIAICYAAQVLPGPVRFERSAGRNLEDQLRRQVLPDGVHASRNPEVIAELLADLLPLAQCYVSASRPVPKDIINAIDRMFPALRFFRHSDGQVAMFHGADGSKAGLVAAVLRHDSTNAKPLGHAPHGGYQRLALGNTVVLADTGKPPQGVHARDGHASSLAFEMSSGRNRLIVNSGVDRLRREVYRDLSRATAAHSSLVVEDTSSARFARFGRAGGRYEVISGPAAIRVERSEDDHSPGFSASHDGYLKSFGLVHERGIKLGDGGARIEGHDQLAAGKAGGRSDRTHAFAIRFHLHPTVRAEKTDRSAVRLVAEQGDIWDLMADRGNITVEESIHLAGIAGPVRTSQVVISGTYPEIDRVRWRILRA